MSLPNITKKGDSFECWLGSQLYDAVARDAMSSHSLFLEICFDKHDLRKLWKPSILPFTVVGMGVCRFFFPHPVVPQPVKINHF